jgi:hypothetical protein
MDLDVLTEAIDQLSDADPSMYSDAESIEQLQRQLARLDSLVTDATAAFDASGNWALDGAQNTSMWLASRCRIPKGTGPTDGAPGASAPAPSRLQTCIRRR